MKKELIVSIISAQSLPNVQIIREMGTENTDYIFVTSKENTNLDWILDACNISDYKCVESDEYDIIGYSKKLSEFDYSQYDKIIVNVTGGTKTMSLAIYMFFCNIPNVQIVYVMPFKKSHGVPKYRVLYPKNEVVDFKTQPNLHEYLWSYGYKFEESPISNIPFEYTKHFFEFFTKSDMTEYDDIFTLLRKQRAKGVKKADMMGHIRPLLNDAEFEPTSEGTLTKEEVQYLTGGWFEEYIYFKLKEELELSDDCILTGVKLTKGGIKSKEKLFKSYLGENVEAKMDTINEFDVVFIKNTTLYIIECKSSIINKIPSVDSKTGKTVYKEENILSKTIYQVDSLKAKLGLYASSFIVTLSDFRELIDVKDNNKKNNITNKIIQDIDRADMSKITIVDLYKLNNIESFREII